jgi:hypothetical protein
MDAASRFAGAARALAERRAEVQKRWLAAYDASRLRVPRPVDLRELEGTAQGILDGLAAGLGEPGAGPGHGALREAEKRVAFAGGNFGMVGATAFDLSALVLALRDVLLAEAKDAAEADALRTIFDWLCALALEGYASSREQALRIRHRDALDRGTPVVMITPDLPVAFLLGDPDRTVLEGAFGRLLLSIVRVGARAAIVDGGGLTRAIEPAVLDALTAFSQHRKVQGAVTLILSGLAPEAERTWRETIGPGPVEVVERFEDAVQKGLQIAGQKISRG